MTLVRVSWQQRGGYMTDEFREFDKQIMTDQPKGGSEALAVSRQPATHLEASGAP